MGLMSSKVEREKLRLGDHIYTWRNGYSYSHHGIYVGDGKVVHLTRGLGLIISSSSRSQPSNDRVVCCNTQDFLDDGQLYRFEYGVSIILFVIKRAGTCLIASSNPPEQVLHRASYLLENEFGNYHFLNKNCEDFAIYCKTGFLKVHRGQGISGKIRSLFTAIAAIVIIPYQFLLATLIGQALTVCGLYYFLRLCDAFGSQGSDYYDVVAVEELDHLSYEHNVRENTNKNIMEKTSTRWFLRKIDYFGYSLWAIRSWYWTPESKIRVWFKTSFLYFLLFGFVTDHLRLHGFELGENSAYTVHILGYLYWRWTSESTLLLWTRLFFLNGFLSSFISDRARSLKLNNYVTNTTFLLELLYWTPRITILLWIKLALLYLFLISFVTDRLANLRLMWRSIFACFLIQSVAIFLGLDYSDYIYRIRKITFV